MTFNRRAFGGGGADWVFTASGGLVQQAPGAVVTFWNALTGGTQYPAAPMPGGVDDGTGLLDGTGHPIASVTTDANGEIPAAVTGPDGIYAMAADASGGAGPRRWVYANDTGTDLAALHALLAAGVFANPMTASGDLIVATAGGNAQRLASGTPGQVLEVASAGVLGWGNSLANPMTTTGDIIVASAGGAAVRMAAGTGTPNQVLAVVNGEPTWFTLPMLVVPPSGDHTGAQDVANINAAITELAAGPGSGDINLLGGEYYTDSTISLPWNMNLRGQGWATVVNFLGGSATVTTPGVSGSVITNTTGQGVQVYLTGGVFTAATKINGVVTGAVGQASLWLPAGQTIQLFYSTAPTWTWVPINSAFWVNDGTNPGNAPFTGQHLTRATIENLVIDMTGAGPNAVGLDIWDVYGGYRAEGLLIRGNPSLTTQVGLRVANNLYSANRLVGDISMTECGTAVLFTTFGGENAIEHINVNFHIQLDAGQTAMHLATSVGLQSCRWEIKVKSIASSGPCIQMDTGTAFQACDFLLKAELAATATTAQTIYYGPGPGAYFTECRGILYFSNNYLASNIGAQKLQFDGDIIGDIALLNAQSAPPYQGYGNSVVTGPAFVTSGTAVTNSTAVGCLVYFQSGTFTAATKVAQLSPSGWHAAVAIGATGFTGPFYVPNGGQITATWSGTAPTAVWVPVGG